jgi:hypothetical protein
MCKRFEKILLSLVVLLAICHESMGLNIKLDLSDFNSQIDISRVITTVNSYFGTQGITSSLILSSFY